MLRPPPARSPPARRRRRRRAFRVGRLGWSWRTRATSRGDEARTSPEPVGGRCRTARSRSRPARPRSRARACCMMCPVAARRRPPTHLKEDEMLRNPDHVTVAVADADAAIRFFALLGFRTQHVAMIDGGQPAQYMGMPDMKAEHITLELEGSVPHFEIQLLVFEPTPD